MSRKAEQIPASSENSSEKLLHGQEKWNLPPIERKQYTEFVRNHKRPFNLGEIISNAMAGDFSGGEFPERAFDRVYLWWSTFEETKALMVRFAAAVQNEYVPDREKKKAVQEFASVRQSFENIITGLRHIVDKSAISPVEAEVLSARMRDFGRLQTEIEQTIALCEAIEQSQLTDPRQIRQRIAQHAIQELSEAFLYENLYYAAGVDVSARVVDDLETERRELLAALLREEWNKQTTKTISEQYEQWRKSVRGLADGEVSRDLTLLWNAATGTKLDRQDAINILDAQDRIFETLQGEGALEWEPEEEEDEEDEGDWDDDE